MSWFAGLFHRATSDFQLSKDEILRLNEEVEMVEETENGPTDEDPVIP